ncbi:hypothetical protein C8Q73DRAFT_787901 [Cubamyces lactineus]|nr:hypothetical protein C8Q73DRAFT_787901 [Cubamyces lactineus]
MKLLLAIAQYDRRGFPQGYEHWSLVAAVPTKEEAYIFDVVGNTDTFTYQTKAKVRLLRSSSLCGGYVVGEVDETYVDWLKDHLATIPVVRNDPTWNCQVWVISAIRELQQCPDKVTIRPDFSANNARQELARQRALWEEAENHFFEDLWPGKAE